MNGIAAYGRLSRLPPVAGDFVATESSWGLDVKKTNTRVRFSDYTPCKSKKSKAKLDLMA